MYILYVQILWDLCISFYESIILTSVGEPEPVKTPKKRLSWAGSQAFLEGAGAGTGKEIYKNGSQEPRAGPCLEGAGAGEKGAKSPTQILTIFMYL